MSRNYEFDVWSESAQDWVLDPARVDEYYESIRFESAYYSDFQAWLDQRDAELEPEPYEWFEEVVSRRYSGK